MRLKFHIKQSDAFNKHMARIAHSKINCNITTQPLVNMFTATVSGKKTINNQKRQTLNLIKRNWQNQCYSRQH